MILWLEQYIPDVIWLFGRRVPLSWEGRDIARVFDHVELSISRVFFGLPPFATVQGIQQVQFAETNSQPEQEMENGRIKTRIAVIVLERPGYPRRSWPVLNMDAQVGPSVLKRVYDIQTLGRLAVDRQTTAEAYAPGDGLEAVAFVPHGQVVRACLPSPFAKGHELWFDIRITAFNRNGPGGPFLRVGIPFNWGSGKVGIRMGIAAGAVGVIAEKQFLPSKDVHGVEISYLSGDLARRQRSHRAQCQ